MPSEEKSGRRGEEDALMGRRKKSFRKKILSFGKG